MKYNILRIYLNFLYIILYFTSDIESLIRNMYNDDEIFIFDNSEEALKFSLKKNKELYPDKKSIFKKIFNKILNKF